MRGSNATGKSERIMTNRYNFYTKIQRTCNATVGLHGQSLDPITRPSEITLDFLTTALSINIKPGYRSWGNNQVCPETNLSFKSLLTLHKVAVPPQSMIDV
ncbi:hypothetical protein M9H77_32120 [Catharanthus roseus]|uniref:Uncharacterized protein n=1 Tax=Catharanthus roseus TaxID=4058 RepID=A0ACC0A4F5_CATRO|nr:hypothetical protein M9H77_32120 [Catharanthus roseus]